MNLYLSPHNDDVCFSIGGLAARLGGELVNLFTTSVYVGADLDLPADDAARVACVSRLRREEDEAFAAAAGLTRHSLELRDARQTGHAPFDLTDLAPEVDLLLAELVPRLTALLPADGEAAGANLYCPMGVGAHRNHLSTLLAVRGAYGRLRRRCAVLLYEDLPYASDASARAEGVRRAAQVFGGHRLSPVVVPLTPDEADRKMDGVRLYASQHARPPDLSNFTPASGLADGAHEIVWRVSPPGDDQA